MHFEEIVVKSTIAENLFVAYSSSDRILHGEFKNPNPVAEKISRFKGYVQRTGDLVVIDCPTGLAVDHLLYALLFLSYVVTTSAGADLAGMKNFVFTVEWEASQYGMAKPFGGAVVNMVRGRGEVKAVARSFPLSSRPPCLLLRRWKKPPRSTSSLPKPYPRSSFTQAVYELAARLGLGERCTKRAGSLLSSLLSLWRR